MKAIYSIDTSDGRIVFYMFDHGKRVQIKQAQADYLIEKGLAKYYPSEQQAKLCQSSIGDKYAS